MSGESFKDRLRILAKVKEITQADIYKATDSNSTTVSNAFQGKHNPRIDFVQSFLRAYPDINGHWLLTGVGEMFLRNSSPMILQEERGEYKTKVDERLDRIEEFLKKKHEDF
jgi:transcriptional regulator with XRE-family HTH domain